MYVIIIFGLIWFFLPILNEIVCHFTTPVLINASEEIEGFWDVLEDPNGIHTRQTLMMDNFELASMNADYPVSSAIEPRRGSWK